MDQRIRLLLDMGVSKENVQAVIVELDKLGGTAQKAAESATRLKGSGGAGGYGMMGASYAFQDFMSVLTMGGGIDRALMSVSNNVDSLGRSLGLSVANAAKMSFAFTSFTVALPILIPLFQSLWESMVGSEGKGPEPVVKALDAAQERLEKIRANLAEILKMTPPGEQDTAKLVKEFLGQEGGGKVVGGLAQAIGASGRGAQMTDAERKEAERTDEDIERLVRVSQMVGENEVREDPEVVRARLQAQRQAARDRAQERINQANVEAAGKLIGQAPMEAGARATIREMATRFPGAFPKGFAGQLGELEPEAQARQQEEDDEWAGRMQRAHEATERRRKARQAQDRIDEQLTHRGRSNEEAGRERAERQESQGRRQDDREQQAALRQHRAEARQAEALVRNRTQIAGENWGVGAAQVASQANPAEIQAMKARTLENLVHGENPTMALLNALRAVYEASERRAAQDAAFVAEINGFSQRIQAGTSQSVMPSGLQR